MTTRLKPEKQRAANREVHPVLAPLREQELMRLLKSVKALRKDLRLIFPANSEPVSAVSAARDLLKTWSDELDRTLAAKQAQATFSQLRNWDNEGGAVDHAQMRHSASGTVS